MSHPTLVDAFSAQVLAGNHVCAPRFRLLGNYIRIKGEPFFFTQPDALSEAVDVTMRRLAKIHMSDRQYIAAALELGRVQKTVGTPDATRAAQWDEMAATAFEAASQAGTYKSERKRLLAMTDIAMTLPMTGKVAGNLLSPLTTRLLQQPPAEALNILVRRPEMAQQIGKSAPQLCAQLERLPVSVLPGVYNRLVVLQRNLQQGYVREPVWVGRLQKSLSHKLAASPACR